MHWLEIAKRLKCGAKIRIKCCGKDDSRMVSHSLKGYSAHCFRCGLSEFKPHDIIKPVDLFRMKEELKDNATATIRLPSDFTTVLPQPSAVWFLRAGIRVDEAQSYGFGYSESMQRTILPVYGPDGTLQYFQGRRIYDWQRPKYITVRGAASASCLFYSQRDHSLRGSAVVLTEDILSAVRVGKVHEAVSILGTSLTKERASQLLGRKTVYVWLDPDKAGQDAAKEVCKKLMLYGMEVFNIVSDKDPKYYNNEQIVDYIVNAKRV